MLSFEMNDRKKIGIGLTGFGVLFFFLGVILLFDEGLLAMGNILFLAGVMLTIGMKSTAQFFMKQSHYKGSIAFVVGFFCGSCWMARHWNDNGSLWLYCSLQWFLVHCFDIFAEDSCSGLVTPTTIP